jgi:hypothetical protein
MSVKAILRFLLTTAGIAVMSCSSNHPSARIETVVDAIRALPTPEHVEKVIGPREENLSRLEELERLPEDEQQLYRNFLQGTNCLV